MPISEAAAFGCPCVSVADFAIPNLVKDGESGLLLRSLPTGSELAKAIRSLIDDPEFYLRLRKGARLAAIENGDWNTIGKRVFETIQSWLGYLQGTYPQFYSQLPEQTLRVSRLWPQYLVFR